jgi:hypothetical protein
MLFVLRGGNNGFRIRLANVLFEDVKVSIPVRREENRPAVSCPIPDPIFSFIPRQVLRVLHRFSTGISFRHVSVPMSRALDHHQLLRVGRNA